jgi:hypothetical protein
MLRGACAVVLTVSFLTGCSGEGGPAAQRRALSASATASAPLGFGPKASDAACCAQANPAVALGAGVFLTVWNGSPYSGLYGVRTRASDGMPLDQRQLLLGPAFASRPAVASDGQGFLVAWDTDGLRAVRVAADGAVLDAPAPVLREGKIGGPAVAFGAGYYLVAWTEDVSTTGPQQYDVFAMRIKASDGKAVAPVIALSTGPTEEGAPSVAFDGTNFLVVWQDRREGSHPAGYANLVRASDGALLYGASGFRVGTSTNAFTPVVAFDGTNYLVAYATSDNGIAGSRVRPADHTSPDVTDLILDNVPSTGKLGAPRLAFDGTNYLMVWHRALGGALALRATRIKPDTGAVLDPGGSVLRAPGTNLSPVPFAAGSGQAMVAFGPGGRENVLYLQLTELDGLLFDPATLAVDKPGFLLSRSGHFQEAPDSSFDGQRYLVVWHEWNGQRFEIRGGRISNEDGTQLDPDGFTISGPGTADHVLPRTASNGSNHLVVWWDGKSLRGGRVKSSDGSLLDGAGFALPGVTGSWYTINSPRYGVASDGTDYLVFWFEYTAIGPTPARAVRVRGSDGALLDTTPRVVAPDSTSRYLAQVTFSGSRYVAAWLESPSDLRAVRLSSDGTVLDPIPRLVATGTGNVQSPLLAGDGENMFVVWTDSKGVNGRRLRLSDGTVLDNSDLPLIGVGTRHTGLAFDGNNFILAWTPYLKTGNSYRTQAMRVGRTGAVLDPGTISILERAEDPPHWVLPVTAGAAGKVLVAYNLYDSSADARTNRVRAQLLSDPMMPDAAVAMPDADVAVPDGGADQALPDAVSPTDQSAPPAEAGMPDAGAPADGATPDGPPGSDTKASASDVAAPSSDAATVDVARPADALGDATATPDAASPDQSGGGGGGGDGCSCRLGGRSDARGVLGLLPLIFLLRRRRGQVI